MFRIHLTSYSTIISVTHLSKYIQISESSRFPVHCMFINNLLFYFDSPFSCLLKFMMKRWMSMKMNSSSRLRVKIMPSLIVLSGNVEMKWKGGNGQMRLEEFPEVLLLSSQRWLGLNLTYRRNGKCQLECYWSEDNISSSVISFEQLWQPSKACRGAEKVMDIKLTEGDKNGQ